MDMSPTIAKAFYDNFGDRNVNTDPAARRQRDTYDQNLRAQPVPAVEKLLKAQNAALRARLAKLEKQSQLPPLKSGSL